MTGVVGGPLARSSEDRSAAVVEAEAVSEIAVRTMEDDQRMVAVEDTEVVVVAAGPATAPAAEVRPMAAATVMVLEGERHRPGTRDSIKRRTSE